MSTRARSEPVGWTHGWVIYSQSTVKLHIRQPHCYHMIIINGRARNIYRFSPLTCCVPSLFLTQVLTVTRTNCTNLQNTLPEHPSTPQCSMSARTVIGWRKPTVRRSVCWLKAFLFESKSLPSSLLLPSGSSARQKYMFSVFPCQRKFLCRRSVLSRPVWIRAVLTRALILILPSTL